MRRRSRAVGMKVDADGNHCVADQLGGGVGVSKAVVVGRCGEDLEVGGGGVGHRRGRVAQRG